MLPSRQDHVNEGDMSVDYELFTDHCPRETQIVGQNTDEASSKSGEGGYKTSSIMVRNYTTCILYINLIYINEKYYFRMHFQLLCLLKFILVET